MKTTKEAILPLTLIALYFLASVAPNYMKPQYKLKTEPYPTSPVTVYSDNGNASRESHGVVWQ